MDYYDKNPLGGCRTKMNRLLLGLVLALLLIVAVIIWRMV